MQPVKSVSSSYANIASPFRIIHILVLSVFFIEYLIMTLLEYLPKLSPHWETFFDAAALVALITPILYFFLFRPLVLQNKNHLILEAELENLQKKTEEMANTKGRFLANMSHEIRTPMSGVIGMVEIMETTRLSTEQQKYLKMIKGAVNDLLMIVNDILDFSKIEAGKYEIEKINFKLRESLQNLVDTFEIKAEAKKIKLTKCFSPEVPEHLIGDPGRLRQIISNLLSNAVKYTEQGEIQLEISIEKQTDEEVTLHFTITDTGIGIPFDKQAAIFEPFVQADKSIARKYGGTGLGLAICAQLAKLMEGKVWLESKVGRGSSFHVSIPFAVHKVAEKEAILAVLQKLQKLPVLVVNDNAVNQLVLRELLKSWQMEPTVVTEETQALRAIVQARKEGRKFSLIIFNDNMVNMDGFTFAAKLRAVPSLAYIKLIMLLSLPENEISCQKTGIDGFVRQPLKKSELLNVITNIFAESLAVKEQEKITGNSIPVNMEMQQKSERIEDNQEPIPQEAVKDKAYHPEINRPLRILLAEDTAVNQEIAVVLLNKQGHSVRVANNGMEALAALGKEPVDLIMMDVQMPVMDGFEATANIRRREKETGRHIPIIAMTANTFKEDQERCLQAGMDDYVSKPIHAERLFQAIERIWPMIKEKDRMTKEAKMAGFIKMEENNVFNLPAGEKLFDEKELMTRLGGRADLLKKIVNLFIDNSPKMLSEIHEAIAKQNPQALDNAAHAFKGAVGTFSAIAAYEKAKELETMGRNGDLNSAEKLFGDLEKEVEQLKPALSNFAKGKLPG